LTNFAADHHSRTAYFPLFPQTRSWRNRKRRFTIRSSFPSSKGPWSRLQLRGWVRLPCSISSG